MQDSAMGQGASQASPCQASPAAGPGPGPISLRNCLCRSGAELCRSAAALAKAVRTLAVPSTAHWHGMSPTLSVTPIPCPTAGKPVPTIPASAPTAGTAMQPCWPAPSCCHPAPPGAQPSTAQPSTAQTAQHSIAQHTQHSRAEQSTAQHSTAQQHTLTNGLDMHQPYVWALLLGLAHAHVPRHPLCSGRIVHRNQPLPAGTRGGEGRQEATGLGWPTSDQGPAAESAASNAPITGWGK